MLLSISKHYNNANDLDSLDIGVGEEDIFKGLKKGIIKALEVGFVKVVDEISSISIETRNKDFMLAFPPFNTPLQQEVTFGIDEIAIAEITEEDTDYEGVGD
jgi:hypothetical protein